MIYPNLAEGMKMLRRCLFCVFLLVNLLLSVILVSACSKSVPEEQSNQSPSKQNDTETVSINQINSTAVNKQVVAEQNLALLPPDIRRIKERGKLTVAMFHQDRPPFFYNNEKGQFVGIDVNLSKDIARSLGVEVEFNRTAKTFDEVVDKVITGQADLAISKLSVTLSRAQRTRYTQPYIVFQQALLVNRLKLAELEAVGPNSDALEIIINSNGKIGVRTATSYVEYARSLFPNAEIVNFDSIKGLMTAVQQGELLAAFYDEHELRAATDNEPELSVYAKLFVLKDRVDPIAIAVAPKDEQLLAWLNIYLDNMKKDPAIDEIVREYGGGFR
jgi:ABC-type amino acid transport substrate-binding protein